jgi:uncharacterized protein YndB with AHSA1/START domain
VISPFIFSRVVDAPRDRVWQSWTEVERLKQWWGPKGFTVAHCKIDLRPGGVMHYCLRMPDGNAMWGKFVYREIVKPERLVFVNSFSDPKGGVTRHPGHASWPLEMLTTVIFEAQAAKTKVTVQWALFDTATDLERKTFDEGRDSMKMGWTGTMDQFVAYLAAAPKH